MTDGASNIALGTFAPSLNTAAINAAAPNAGVTLSQAAILGPIAIPSITIGSDVYTFSYTAATSGARLYDYTTAATVISIRIKKN